MLNLWFSARRVGRASLADGYALFGALCRLGLVEHGDRGVQILLRPRGLLVRCGSARAAGFAEELPRVLPLGPGRLQLGEPWVDSLQPAAALGAQVVVIKNATDDRRMQAACSRQLGELGVAGRVQIGPRRVVVVAGQAMVGYQVRVVSLSPAGSLTLQARGLGGKRTMGCGVFLPC